MRGEDVVHIDSNDPKAIEQFIERYRVIADRLCFQYGVNPKQIPTVVQDVFIKIDQKLKRQEIGSLAMWFYQVVIRTLREHEKKQKKAHKLGNSIDNATNYGYYLEKQGHISIQGILAKLDNKYKLPLILHHYHEIKLEEISTILKVNDETITKRIQQGINLLSENYKKAATTMPFLVDNFEAIFSDMKYSYQLLPEFTSTVDIITRIEQTRKKKRWQRYLPPAGAVIGLFVFAILGLNYMQEQKVAIEAAKELEKANQTSESQDVEKNKEEELNPEIAEYLEEAIANFARELGLDDASTFPIVLEVQTIINDLKQHPDNMLGSDVQETKKYIDMMLMTPAVQLKNLKEPQEAEEYSLISTLGVFYSFEYQFQNYLNTLLSDIPIEEYDVIYQLQDKPEKYNGSKEIKTLLHILNEQGFIIRNDIAYNYLTVHIDMEELKSKLIEKKYGDAYLAFIDYYKNVYDFEWNNWQEFDNILLEAESLLTTYGDSYSEEILRELYNNIEHHLYGYLGYWHETRQVSEVEKEEYYSFINNHPDSKVAQIIQSYLHEWEGNDWKRTQNYSYTEPIDIFFAYDNVKFEDIVKMGRWPFLKGIGEVYKDYNSNLDASVLVNLSPFEIVALFAYAYEKEDKETYTTLTSQDTNQLTDIEWLNLRNMSGYGLTEYHDDSTAKVIFTDWEIIDVETIEVLTIELIKVNDIWKIKQIRKDSSF